MGERAFLAALRRTAALREASSTDSGRHTRVRLGMGDDCAIVHPAAGEEIVITTDLFLEQVHFQRDWHQPEVAGHRCLTRGLSDIAAMGAVPVAAFLSLALPEELAGLWIRRFLRGFWTLAGRHGVVLAGGDTAQAPAPYAGRDYAGRDYDVLKPVSVRSLHAADKAKNKASSKARNKAGKSAGALFSADIVLLGRLPRGKALLRSGARPGDLVYVTGTLGGAAAELDLLRRAPATYAHLLRPTPANQKHHPHLFPTPRLAAGVLLRGRATAAIDLSDGLSTDLAHLCEESNVAAEICPSLLPIDPLAQAQNALPETALELALHGGEDYELLFTAPSGVPTTLAGTPVRCIGSIVKSSRGRPRVSLIDANGRKKPLRNRGWEHFPALGSSSPHAR